MEIKQIDAFVDDSLQTKDFPGIVGGVETYDGSLSDLGSSLPDGIRNKNIDIIEF
jgi:hypothetical protein